MKKPIVCLMGPTACGKTKLAIELVQQFPFEIISVDSAMVYREMDIGTAKPTPEELEKAPHRLINIRDPAEPYSVGQFCEDARREIKDIHDQGKIPLLVGGTMLYFHLLQKGFADLPAANKTTQKMIRAEVEKRGLKAMHEVLKSIDPKAADHIHANDSQRIQRALEVYYSTGHTVTQLYNAQQFKLLPNEIINLIVAYKERKLLHQLIERRFDNMLRKGFIEEVKSLYQRGDLNDNLPSIRTVGYRQAWYFLKGEYDKATMREYAIIATRQLAKRQYTWLRRWKDAAWFYQDDKISPEQGVVDLLKKQLSSS